MTSEQPDKYENCKNENNQIATFFQNPTFSELNSNCVWKYCFMQVKTEITDLFWKFLIKLYIAKNLPSTRKNKRHMISLFASNNV